MDRRQKKTKTAIYSAFTELLGNKDFSLITVQEIIDTANVGRATFYAHFETKDYLLKEMCEEIFSHILGNADTHYKCDMKCSFYLHLLRHIKNNDDNMLRLLSGRKNELFLSYFKESLKRMVLKITDEEVLNKINVPKDFYANFISAAFVESVMWWAQNGFKKTPEEISDYLHALIGEKLMNCCKNS